MVIQRKTVFASNTKKRSAFVNARKRKKKIPDEIIGGAVAYTTPFPICPLSLCFKTRLSAKLIFYSHGNETHLPNKGFALSWFIASIWKWEFLELGNGLLDSFSDIAIWNACSFRIKGICRTSNSLTNAVFLPLKPSISLGERSHLSNHVVQKSHETSLTWHFRYKFLTPPRQRRHSPLLWVQMMVKCPGFAWDGRCWIFPAGSSQGRHATLFSKRLNYSSLPTKH